MDLIAYIRVSTDDQAEHGHSLSQQRERLTAYCALHGHRLVDVVIDDGVSAGKPLHTRPGGRALVEAIRMRRGVGVLVTRLDRLFRDAFDGLRFFADLAPGATVHSVTELIDTGTPAGRLQVTIQLAAAQYEREMAQARAVECNAALRRAGRVYGTVPYGCVSTPDKRLLRDPELWATRELIVALRAEQGYSYKQIAYHLRARKIPSPAGARSWSISTIQTLVKTHADLCHLPVAIERASSTPDAHDTEASTDVRQLVH